MEPPPPDRLSGRERRGPPGVRSPRLPRDVAWRRLDGPGFEHLRLDADAGGVRADGLIVVGASDGWRRLRYHLDLGADWTVRRFGITDADERRRALRGRRDESGRWTAEGRAIDVASDARFVDIAATPFTNALPIRACRLDVGEAVDQTVLYLSGPEVPPRIARQRYTRLAAGRAGDRYRYESLESGYGAELTVDAHGLVVDYPTLFERVTW